MKEACKVLKYAKKRPTSEIQLGSPSGASQLSALGNPEYLLPPPAHVSKSTIESVTCDSNNFDAFSPLKFTPQKRNGPHSIFSDPNKEPRSTLLAPIAEPVALNFEDASVRSDLNAVNNNHSKNAVINF